MLKKHYTDVEEQIPTEEGVKDTKIRWLLTDKDGAKNFAMRVFTIQPGGHTPHHTHDWEHELFMLEGEAVLRSGDEKIPFKPGEFAFIQANELHQIRNESAAPAIVMCLIPYKGKCD
jgi:quercetin dioxygenase-like cupin family protein